MCGGKDVGVAIIAVDLHGSEDDEIEGEDDVPDKG